ncbi:MAG: Tex-like N-terminal domain-containing protein, partial [Halanaerobiaceae bacterium]
MKEKLLQIIVEELKLKKSQVKGTVALLEEGNTVPFIARYRKEKTGKLDESEIRNVKERIEYLQKLEERKESVISLIDNQDRLTDEIKSKILSARSLQEVEDLYRPYKQKRQTRATKAKKKGLEPLAELIWEQELFAGDVNKIGGEYIDPDVELDTVEDVYRGARDIIAEWISDDPEIRKKIREFSFDSGCIQCKCKDEKLDEEDKYEMYYQYNEKIKKIPPHRTLAINRGEDEDVLQVKV